MKKAEKKLRIELKLLEQMPQSLDVLALRVTKMQELVAIVEGKTP